MPPSPFFDKVSLCDLAEPHPVDIDLLSPPARATTPDPACTLSQ